VCACVRVFVYGSYGNKCVVVMVGTVIVATYMQDMLIYMLLP